MALVFFKGLPLFSQLGITELNEPCCTQRGQMLTIAIKHHIEFIVTETMSLGTSENLNVNFK